MPHIAKVAKPVKKKKTKSNTKHGSRSATSSEAKSLVGGSGGGFGGFNAGFNVGWGGGQTGKHAVSGMKSDDPQIQFQIGKLSKKDATTKVKALRQLTELLRTKTKKEIGAFAGVWVFYFEKLSLDLAREVRAATFGPMQVILEVNKKALGVHMPTLFGSWWNRIHDVSRDVSSVAKACFEEAFVAEKRPKIYAFCLDEYLYFIEEKFRATPESLSDMEVTDQASAQERFANVMVASLMGLAAFLTANDPKKMQASQSILSTCLENGNTLKRLKGHKQPTVRKSLYTLITALCTHCPGVIARNLKAFTAVVFQALDESALLAQASMWLMTLHFLKNFPGCWDLIDARKKVLPRFLKALKASQGGKIDPYVVAFLSRIPDNVIYNNNNSTIDLEAAQTFYSKILAALWQSTAFSFAQTTFRRNQQAVEVKSTAFCDVLVYIAKKHQVTVNGEDQKVAATSNVTLKAYILKILQGVAQVQLVTVGRLERKTDPREVISQKDFTEIPLPRDNTRLSFIKTLGVTFKQLLALDGYAEDVWTVIHAVAGTAFKQEEIAPSQYTLQRTTALFVALTKALKEEALDNSNTTTTTTPPQLSVLGSALINYTTVSIAESSPVLSRFVNNLITACGVDLFFPTESALQTQLQAISARIGAALTVTGEESAQVSLSVLFRTLQLLSKKVDLTALLQQSLTTATTAFAALQYTSAYQTAHMLSVVEITNQILTLGLNLQLALTPDTAALLEVYLRVVSLEDVSQKYEELAQLCVVYNPDLKTILFDVLVRFKTVFMEVRSFSAEFCGNAKLSFLGSALQKNHVELTLQSVISAVRILTTAVNDSQTTTTTTTTSAATPAATAEGALARVLFEIGSFALPALYLVTDATADILDELLEDEDPAEVSTLNKIVRTAEVHWKTLTTVGDGAWLHALALDLKGQLSGGADSESKTTSVTQSVVVDADLWAQHVGKLVHAVDDDLSQQSSLLNTILQDLNEPWLEAKATFEDEDQAQYALQKLGCVSDLSDVLTPAIVFGTRPDLLLHCVRTQGQLAYWDASVGAEVFVLPDILAALPPSQQAGAEKKAAWAALTSVAVGLEDSHLDVGTTTALAFAVARCPESDRIALLSELALTNMAPADAGPVCDAQALITLSVFAQGLETGSEGYTTELSNLAWVTLHRLLNHINKPDVTERPGCEPAHPLVMESVALLLKLAKNSANFDIEELREQVDDALVCLVSGVMFSLKQQQQQQPTVAVVRFFASLLQIRPSVLALFPQQDMYCSALAGWVFLGLRDLITARASTAESLAAGLFLHRNLIQFEALISLASAVLRSASPVASLMVNPAIVDVHGTKLSDLFMLRAARPALVQWTAGVEAAFSYNNPLLSVNEATLSVAFATTTTTTTTTSATPYHIACEDDDMRVHSAKVITQEYTQTSLTLPKIQAQFMIEEPLMVSVVHILAKQGVRAYHERARDSRTNTTAVDVEEGHERKKLVITDIFPVELLSVIVSRIQSKTSKDKLLQYAPEATEDLLNLPQTERERYYLLCWYLVLDRFPKLSMRERTAVVTYIQEYLVYIPLLDLTFDDAKLARAELKEQGSTLIVDAVTRCSEVCKHGLPLLVAGDILDQDGSVNLPLVTKIYMSVLRFFPSSSRSWWLDCEKSRSQDITTLTAKYFSPALLEDELNLIRDRFNGEQQEDEHQHEDHDDHADVESEFLVKIGGARVKAKYEFLDVVMNISFKIPVSYPLLNVVVEMKKLIKVSTQQAQHLELKMKRILSSHNKTLKDAIVMWKQEMDSHFTGVEECTICYYVMNNYRELPRMTCKTCKKIFHAGCLYKWFESSGKSTCPMCRALF